MSFSNHTHSHHSPIYIANFSTQPKNMVQSTLLVAVLAFCLLAVVQARHKPWVNRAGVTIYSHWHDYWWESQGYWNTDGLFVVYPGSGASKDGSVNGPAGPTTAPGELEDFEQDDAAGDGSGAGGAAGNGAGDASAGNGAGGDGASAGNGAGSDGTGATDGAGSDSKDAGSDSKDAGSDGKGADLDGDGIPDGQATPTDGAGDVVTRTGAEATPAVTTIPISNSSAKSSRSSAGLFLGVIVSFMLLL